MGKVSDRASADDGLVCGRPGRCDWNESSLGNHSRWWGRMGWDLDFEAHPGLWTSCQDKGRKVSSLVNNSNITVSTNLKDWDLLIKLK